MRRLECCPARWLTRCQLRSPRLAFLRSLLRCDAAARCANARADEARCEEARLIAAARWAVARCDNARCDACGSGRRMATVEASLVVIAGNGAGSLVAAAAGAAPFRAGIEPVVSGLAALTVIGSSI